MRGELISLLAAAKQAPDDPLARLILADWLDENGDGGDRARAELLRLEAVAGPGPPFASPDEAGVRQAELVRDYARDWLPGVGVEETLHGGFVHVRARVEDLPGLEVAAARAGERWGWVEELGVLGQGLLALPRLVASSLTRRGLALDLRGCEASRADWRAFWQAPELATLTGLTLYGEDLDRHGLLAGSPPTGLAELTLVNCQRGSRFLADAVDSPRMPHLARLQLRGPWLAEMDDLEALGASPGLRRLVGLSLFLPAATGRPVLQSQFLTRLGRLGLSGNLIDQPGTLLGAPCLATLDALDVRGELSVLARDSAFHALEGAKVTQLILADRAVAGEGGAFRVPEGLAARLRRHLSLADNGLTGVAWGEALGRLPLGRLRSLDLRGNDLTPPALLALAANPHLGRLRWLDLSGSHVGGGLAALCASPAFAGLEVLHLSRTRLGDADAAALADSGRLHHLSVLDLSVNRIGDAGVLALARSPILQRVVRLDLAGNPISLNGYRALAESPHLHNLSELRVVLAGPDSERVRRGLSGRFGSILRDG